MITQFEQMLNTPNNYLEELLKTELGETTLSQDMIRNAVLGLKIFAEVFNKASMDFYLVIQGILLKNILNTQLRVLVFLKYF